MIENENQAKITRDWVKKFGDRLRMIELERASLQGIINDLQEQLTEYSVRKMHSDQVVEERDES